MYQLVNRKGQQETDNHPAYGIDPVKFKNFLQGKGQVKGYQKQVDQ
jgi:hypothetical protein